jgi:hypothetical protein
MPEQRSAESRKKRLPGSECLIVSAPRHQTGLKLRRRESAGSEKVEENSKFPLTAERHPLKFLSRCKVGFAANTAKNWFFQLLGLQIELNLVPTMNERQAQTLSPVKRKIWRRHRIEFFAARKLEKRASRSLKV